MTGRLALILLLLLWTGVAGAHKPSDSYLSLVIPAQGSAVAGRWDIALRDLEYVVGVDRNGDGAITWGELKARRQAVTAYAFARLQVTGAAGDGTFGCPLDFRQLLVAEHVDGAYAVLLFDAACAARPADLTVAYDLLFDVDPSHQGLLQVTTPDVTHAAVLTSGSPSVSLALARPSIWRTFTDFLGQGIWHIWIGYDHILFLLTLLFPAVLVRRGGRWTASPSLRASAMDVLKVVTAFTVTHSFSLVLAVLGLVQVPSRLVESAIALTVVLGAFNNLYPVLDRRRWLMAGAFGLVHGLGFASVLADLGLPPGALVVSLFGFNVGVEVGQAAIVLLFIPLAHAARDTAVYRHVVVHAGSLVIAILAGYWFVGRAFGPM